MNLYIIRSSILFFFLTSHLYTCTCNNNLDHNDMLLGAVYCDEELRSNGMRGEGIRSGAVIVTKTHLFGPQWTDRDKPGFIRKNVSY